VAYQGDSVVTIEERHDEDGAHLSLRGRLDARTAADVRLTLRRTIGDGASTLHVDLGEVVIGDATGIGVLVEALRYARRARRRMHVVAADARTVRLMRRARLGGLLLAPQEGELAGAVG
jgi:anti-anti-sigma factor